MATIKTCSAKSFDELAQAIERIDDGIHDENGKSIHFILKLKSVSHAYANGLYSAILVYDYD